MSDDFGAFLRSRRARLRPEEVGFAPGRGRRVPGLRREEVAALASVSVDYISRLEQGRISPSEAVLHSLARALQLDAAERVHMFALACRTPRSEDIEPLDDVRPALLRLLDAVEPLPAYVLGRSLDLLTWNATASLLFGDLERRLLTERNLARLIFLDAEFGELVGPPDRFGADVVAALRVAQTRHQRDPRVEALIGELAERSAAFRTLWEEHPVATKAHGRSAFDHPQVGCLVLDWQRLTVPGAGGQALMVYSAEPGTPSSTALTLLGALAATAAETR